MNITIDFHTNTIDDGISTLWSVTKTSCQDKEYYSVVKNMGHPKSETHYIAPVKAPDGKTLWQDLDGQTSEEFAQIGASIIYRNSKLKK